MGLHPIMPVPVRKDLTAYLVERAALIDRWLDELVRPPERTPAPRLWEAMRYSLLAPGKRFRPVLMLAVGETFGTEMERYRYSACAIECIHTYSLIHDDLPAMDNDTLRRGRPACHVRFGEAMAILAGDALLTYAFELLGRCPFLNAHPAIGLEVMRILALRAGLSGMVVGQVLDLEAEGRPVDAAHVQRIHRYKTAALITAACEIGGKIAQVEPRVQQALQAYGEALGIAFQIVDDILDVTQTSQVLGKTAGKDVQTMKATYPRAVGLDRAREEAIRWRERAKAAVTAWDRKGLLHALADRVTERIA